MAAFAATQFPDPIEPMQTVATEAEEKRYSELQALALDYARTGETESLAQMLRHGLPVNLADAKGNSLLMLASYNGHPDTARMLLEAGAAVDRRNDRGQTPLGGVAFKGDEVTAVLLLTHGADIDADNGGGMTPIMFAAMFGRTKVVELLQREGASLRRRNRLGFSANLMVRWSRGLAYLRQKLRLQTDRVNQVAGDIALLRSARAELRRAVLRSSHSEGERRGRDSNPRYLAAHLISSQAHSTTLPPLHA